MASSCAATPAPSGSTAVPPCWTASGWRRWRPGPPPSSPTASLDPAAARAVEEIIGAIHRGGTKIIMTTHNLGQAHRLADEILFLDQGRLVERSPANRFFREPASAEAAAYMQGELL